MSQAWTYATRLNSTCLPPLSFTWGQIKDENVISRVVDDSNPNSGWQDTGSCWHLNTSSASDRCAVTDAWLWHQTLDCRRGRHLLAFIHCMGAALLGAVLAVTKCLVCCRIRLSQNTLVLESDTLSIFCAYIDRWTHKSLNGMIKKKTR
jgi:hypothetical protein